MTRLYKIIRPVNLRPRPDEYEEHVAELCAAYFKSDVMFLLRNNHTTPDIQVCRTRTDWEIKNIKGAGRHMIENNLRRASRQSKNIIISSLKKPKMPDDKICSQIKHILKVANLPIEHVIFVTRDAQIIDIK